jgi:type III restriction enzyme
MVYFLFCYRPLLDKIYLNYARNEVVVYTKLPNGFYINTPVGHYNPDWTVVLHECIDIKHIYFVAKTKGYDKDSRRITVAQKA